MEDQKLRSSDPAPSFCMIDLQESHDGLDYAFMYNSKRFYVSILIENLESDGGLLQHFQDLKDDLEDPENMFQFEEWVLGALNEFLEANAPTPTRATRQPVTLLEYYSPPTFAFTLVNQHGKLCAIPDTYHRQICGDSSPRTRIIESTTSSALPEDSVLKSSLPPVPYFLSSELERIDDDLQDEELSDIPRKVRRRDSGTVLFFKAGLKYHGHLREIDLLYKISQIDDLAKSSPTSKLVGLVVWDDDNTSLMGFLLEYIEGQTLRQAMNGGTEEMKKQWIDEIENTLGRLHDAGIVWGDAKSDNVIINDDGRAVVIDFGGGYTPGYIPMHLQQTIEGDLMALDRMREEMGLSRKASWHL